MFEKLLAVLPYNPGLGQQLAFYARRMREEAAIRRTGMVFIVLAFLVQFFAVLSPPVATNANSDNDMISGPVTSKAQIISACRNNTSVVVGSYRDVMRTFGITCDDIDNTGHVVSINSKDTNADGNRLFSMGWVSHPQGVDGTSSEQQKFDVLNYSEPIYSRLLRSWDTGSNIQSGSTYTAVQFTANIGGVTKTFYILFGCGNLVSFGQPKPYTPPTPVLTIHKSMLAGFPAAGSTVAPGTTLIYVVDINNTGDGAANNVVLTDALPDHTTYVSMSENTGASQHIYQTASRTAKWTWDSIGTAGTGRSVALKVTIDAATPNGTKVCNVAQVDSGQTGPKTSNQVCVNVTKSPPPPVVTPPPTCQNGGIPSDSPQCNPTCANGGIASSSPQCSPNCANGGIPTTIPVCHPATCPSDTASASIPACTTIHKTAFYGTTSGPNADGTTAQAGNVITYTLYAQNVSKQAINPFVFKENMSDVLDYADITDLHGGTLDNVTKNVSWPGMNLAPDETVTRQITVTVKSPIPQTPPGLTDPQHFDLLMTNVYGNAINIKLPPSAPLVVQQAAANLPNTGPGTSLFIAAAIMVLGGYFYSRARLLQEESTIAVQEAANA